MTGRFLRLLPEHLTTLAALLTLVMMLHVSLDVVLKYLFRVPVPATVEVVSYYYMVAAVFLPIAWSEKIGAGITVDLFMMRAPGWLQFAAAILALVLGIAIYAGLAVNTFQQALRALAHREVVMGPISLPVWPSRFLLPLGFGLAALICAGQLWRLATRQSTGHEADHEQR